MGSDYDDLVEAIDKTRGNAIRVKGRLNETANGKALATITLGVRKEISIVNDHLGSVVGKLATEIPQEEAHQE